MNQGDPTQGETNQKRLRRLNLAIAWLCLAAITPTSAIILARLAAIQNSTVLVSVYGSTLSFNRLWLLAAVAGLLGGSVRGAFMLIVENYAYEYKRSTAKTSEWAFKMLAYRGGLKTIDDDFDPLTNWWAYPLKPVMGAGFGFLFGLLQILGLIPFLKEISSVSQDTSVVVVAVLAGLLTEEAVSKLQDLFGGGDIGKTAPEKDATYASGGAALEQTTKLPR